MKTNSSIVLPAVAALLLVAGDATAAGDADRGSKQFRQCVACHSVTPGEHLTGPSLAGVVGRKAGTVEGFDRYSEALKQSELTWTEGTLDEWLKAPAELVPGTSMRIRGVADPVARQDIVAFLKTMGAESDSKESGAADGAGMMDSTGGSRLVDLGNRNANQQVAAIRYCGDAYKVTLGTGETYTFWEFNLRFKTDSSEKGPARGKPVILPSGMQGDRAFVIFADPAEISDFIRKAC